jgi:hypothetical protein
MTWLRTRCAINLQDSASDPLVRGTDPRIRICTKKSRIHNTVYNYLYMFSTVQPLLLLLVNVKYVQPYETTLFQTENNAPFYRFFRIQFRIRIRIRIRNRIQIQIRIRIRNVYFGSRSDPDLAKRFGSFRIRNTAFLIY